MESAQSARTVSAEKRCSLIPQGLMVLVANEGANAYRTDMMRPVTPTERAATPVADQELAILNEIGEILSSTSELRDAFARIMQVISDKLNMHRGTLVLLDESTGRLRTEAAIGLTPDDIERNRFALGEGVTGNVVATGRARIIHDVRTDPDFLNRAGRLGTNAGDPPISFLCIPIKIEGRTAGALSVDKPQ